MESEAVLPTISDIARRIDHAILKPQTTRDELDAELAVVAGYDTFSVCVRPSDVAHSVEQLTGTNTVVGTVLGFPHGTTTTQTKVAEAAQAIADGAVELDLVLNIGWLRSALVDEVERDIAAVVRAADGTLVKVILETCYLTDDEIVAACAAAQRAGADFVKTSTGFGTAGATVDAVSLMRRTVGDALEVKASGGIRDLDTLLAMRDAGATRFGISSTPVILDDLAGRLAGRAPTGAVGTGSY